MMKLEMRQRAIYYCDWCKKEIAPPFTSFRYKDSEDKHFCSDYISQTEKHCADKQRDRDIYEYKKLSVVEYFKTHTEKETVKNFNLTTGRNIYRWKKELKTTL